MGVIGIAGASFLVLNNTGGGGKRSPLRSVGKESDLVSQTITIYAPQKDASHRRGCRVSDKAVGSFFTTRVLCWAR